MVNVWVGWWVPPPPLNVCKVLRVLELSLDFTCTKGARFSLKEPFALCFYFIVPVKGQGSKMDASCSLKP